MHPPNPFVPVPKVNAIVDRGVGGWHVTCWGYDNPAITKQYTISATSDNKAAQEGIRLFLAEHAPSEGSACLDQPPA